MNGWDYSLWPAAGG